MDCSCAAILSSLSASMSRMRCIWRSLPLISSATLRWNSGVPVVLSISPATETSARGNFTGGLDRYPFESGGPRGGGRFSRPAIS